MKNNKNGFTLVELLVCIGIIAALGVAVGLSSNKIVQNSKYRDYEETMLEIFNAASIYVELSDSKCNGGFTTCEVQLSDLVEKGLVDKNIYNKNNPVYVDSVSFGTDDKFTVTKTNGMKDVTYFCNSEKNIKLSTVDDDSNWGKC